MPDARDKPNASLAPALALERIEAEPEAARWTGLNHFAFRKVSRTCENSESRIRAENQSFLSMVGARSDGTVDALRLIADVDLMQRWQCPLRCWN
jgi:hypothetical protein